LDASPFGTLTLGANSTLQLSAAGKTGLPNSKTVYFSNGSYLELTAGDFNRSATYNVLPGATASFKPGNSGSDTIVSGSAVGASDSVLSININNVSIFRTRWSCAAFLGTMNYTSGSNQRQVDLSNFATANTAAGPGITSFGNNVNAALGASDRMSDSATVKLAGGAGGSNIKFNGNADRSDTIANLIIESPVTNSSAYIQMRNGFLRSTNSVSFQGTAGTVQIDNNLWPSIYNAGLDARNADITFSGTGSWAVTGDGQLYLNTSSTITTTNDATLSCIVRYDSGTLNKYGAGTLTLDANNFTNLFNASLIRVYAGDMVFSGGVGSATNLTGGVSFEDVYTSFKAAYDGTFADIAAVQADTGDGLFFHLGTGVKGSYQALDNGDSTFTVKARPIPGGTIIFVK
jgi:hypothetical protein